MKGCAAVLAVLALVALPPSVRGAERQPRVTVGVGVLPQMDQFVGTTSLPAELYRAELLLPTGRNWHVGPELAGRRDFAVVGFGLHRELGGSEEQEWRLALALDYTFPLSDTGRFFDRLKGKGSSTLDRLHLRLAVGQTFDLRRAGVGLRVEYGVRLMLPGSLLSVLESLDDPADAREGFWMHEITAGLEFRRGGGR
jgi:hypothetical protein